MNPDFSTEQMEMLIPLAADWAAEQEQRILREGVPLTADEIADAKAAGVKEPERVRLLPVETIPTPTHPLLRAAYSAINLVSSGPRGLTLNHGIFVRRDCRQDRHLLVHELVHISQYERLGGILPFLRKYLGECFTIGYRKAPLEEEANEVAERLCSG